MNCASPLCTGGAGRKTGHSADQIVRDLAKLLFTHQVYKNYPVEFVEKKRYAELTRWLGKLTTVDLTNVNMEGVKSLDEWLTRLDNAGMFVFHSTGTSGKLSFFPRSQVEKEAGLNPPITFLEAFQPRHPLDPPAGVPGRATVPAGRRPCD